MDCRETQALLTAFHDGELPGADRARVEGHLSGCPECGALLADLARADAAAGVPDPGPGYWDRFNARVMDRIEREAEGPGVTALRPKRGWVRQQLRYLVPAAAAAALVVVVVRHVAQHPGVPPPTAPLTARQPAVSDPAGQLMSTSDIERRTTEKKEDPAVARRVPVESGRVAGAPPPPPPAAADERFAAVPREERDRLADRSLQEENGRASRERAAAPAVDDAPSPPPPMTYRGTPAAPPPVNSAGGVPSRAPGEPQPAAKAESASGTRLAKDPDAASPCELARTLAAQGRLKEAEAVQRACLAQDRSAPTQEKGLIFLAELLDRQARFAEADAVISEVHRQFPHSLPLDLYRQQRPMVQKQQMPAPVTR